MSDVASAPQGPETISAPDTGAAPETTPSAPTTDSAPPSSGNPAWEPLRQKLDPMLFKSIEADLQNWDREAQKRIESVNQQYAPFKALVDQGATPEIIAASLRLAHEIDSDPVTFHSRLTEYLRTHGRLPQNQAEMQEALEEDPDEQEEDDEPTSEDPRLQQLQQEQLRMRQQFELQQRAFYAQQAEAELTSEQNALVQAHPELTPEDVQEVIRRAASTALMNRQAGINKIPTLEESYQELAEYRNRILSAPRAGDSAPRLLPPSGGTPAAGGERKPLGKLSSQETIDLLAGLVSGGRSA